MEKSPYLLRWTTNDNPRHTVLMLRPLDVNTHKRVLIQAIQYIGSAHLNSENHGDGYDADAELARLVKEFFEESVIDLMPWERSEEERITEISMEPITMEQKSVLEALKLA